MKTLANAGWPSSYSTQPWPVSMELGCDWAESGEAITGGGLVNCEAAAGHFGHTSAKYGAGWSQHYDTADTLGVN